MYTCIHVYRDEFIHFIAYKQVNYETYSYSIVGNDYNDNKLYDTD